MVPKQKGARWYKDVGLGFKTPQEAITGVYIDKKCPFTGDVSIRGRIITGTVMSTKMERTIIVRRDYLHFIPKYNRYEKRHKNIAAHCSPAFVGIAPGDVVTIGECRYVYLTLRCWHLEFLYPTNNPHTSTSEYNNLVYSQLFQILNIMYLNYPSMNIINFVLYN